MFQMLKVINLFAEPGAGKSTTAAGLFNLMKFRGEKVELVTEFAKDLTYQRDYGSLKNQLYTLAMQDFRQHRLRDQVEWCITDSPLPLSLVYATDEYLPWLRDTVDGAWKRYRNYNFLISRTKPYQTFGRFQTEQEARGLRDEIATLAAAYSGGKYALIPGNERAPKEIAARLGMWDGVEP